MRAWPAALRPNHGPLAQPSPFGRMNGWAKLGRWKPVRSLYAPSALHQAQALDGASDGEGPFRHAPCSGCSFMFSARRSPTSDWRAGPSSLSSTDHWPRQRPSQPCCIRWCSPPKAGHGVSGRPMGRPTLYWHANTPLSVRVDIAVVVAQRQLLLSAVLQHHEELQYVHDAEWPLDRLPASCRHGPVCFSRDGPLTPPT